MKRTLKRESKEPETVMGEPILLSEYNRQHFGVDQFEGNSMWLGVDSSALRLREESSRGFVPGCLSKSGIGLT